MEISELCILGLSWAILRRWPRDQTMKAFIGRLTCAGAPLVPPPPDPPLVPAILVPTCEEDASESEGMGLGMSERVDVIMCSISLLLPPLP